MHRGRHGDRGVSRTAVKLQVGVHRCGPCGEPFEALHLPEGAPYGTFLLRSESGLHLARLDATDDGLFAAIGEAVVADRGDHRARASEVQRLYGLACDRAPCGGPFVVEGDPPCPRCGARTSSWSLVDRFVWMDVAPVTHDAWDRLNDKERTEFLRTLTKRSSGKQAP
jgi:hypothetical protein